ncbi:2596_t:CDS:2 [Entrophospora sp. SA101]|nr:2596_t:CDS:2 [Entrophospora sp. SA101]
MLMMRAAVKWIDYDLDKTYDIMIAFPDLQLPLHVNNRGQTKIAVCSSSSKTPISNSHELFIGTSIQVQSIHKLSPLARFHRAVEK